jgi:hypothetical protein
MSLQPQQDNVLEAAVNIAVDDGANYVRYAFHREEEGTFWTLHLIPRAVSIVTPIEGSLQDPLELLQSKGFLFLHRGETALSHKGIVILQRKAFVHVLGAEKGESTYEAIMLTGDTMRSSGRRLMVPFSNSSEQET